MTPPLLSYLKDIWIQEGLCVLMVMGQKIVFSLGSGQQPSSLLIIGTLMESLAEV